MDSQSTDGIFRQHCRIVLDNSGSIGDTKKQLEAVIKQTQ